MSDKALRNRKEHWEEIYRHKKLQEVSWYQPYPEIALVFFKKYNIPKHARILDVGGGDSLLVDHLLEMGYQNVTVLDISEAAIIRAKNRLGDKASQVQWVISDVLEFEPEQLFDVWHDRATFHFLTTENEVNAYVALANEWIRPEGFLFLGTFSTNGPRKCSGILIQQYDESSLTQKFNGGFHKLDCFISLHRTPSHREQEFLFCALQKKSR